MQTIRWTSIFEANTDESIGGSEVVMIEDFAALETINPV